MNDAQRAPRAAAIVARVHPADRRDRSALYDDAKSLNEGAITIPGYSMEGWYGRIFRGCGYFDPDNPIRDFTKNELHDLLHKEPTKIKIEGINLTYTGLIPTIQKSYSSKDLDALQPHIRAFVERAVTFTACPDCGGTRLNEAARSSKIEGISIADACAMQISDLAAWVRGLEARSVAPLLGKMQQTLDSFVEIGLGYLSLDRPAGTLGCGCATRGTRCWSWSTSRRRSRSPTTSSTSAPARDRPAARSVTRGASRGCARAAPSSSTTRP